MGTPLCVLVVDDSPFFLELEKQFLKNTPATLLSSLSGPEAIVLAREHRPSLIFMDVDMPETSGTDCCRQFKSDPELKDIPIVLIGDQNGDLSEQEALAAGASAYLEKPLDRRDFLNIGHSFLVSIDRREPRLSCVVPVDYTCRGRRLEGRCIDVSSGGMFLECEPTAETGEPLLLKFSLPDAERTVVEVDGRIAWTNSDAQVIKDNYPHGYGVEFVDICKSVGAALRRHFGT